MATVTFTASDVIEGFIWSMEFTSVTESTAVNNSAQYNGSIGINLLSPNVPSVFNVSSFNTYGGSGVEYSTWRSESPSGGGQYPSSGQSVDIWSQSLYNEIVSNNTWNNIAGTHALSSTKWSLVYDYNNPHAKFYSKGGTLNVTVT